MPARITTDVHEAAAVLRRGGLVAFGTETVYGLGAVATDVQAVARVFEVKGRPRFDPLIVHIADRRQLPLLAADVTDLACRLASRFWPGPLTLVLPKTPLVPDLVTAGRNSVAVRIPDHPLALELLRLADVPVAAPSANPFGRISPTTAAHVWDQLGDRIDLILDGGPCRVGLESTVVSFAANMPVLLRPGGLTVEELAAVVGPVASAGSETNPVSGQGALAPGLLPQHYAPRTPLQVVQDWSAAPSGSRVGALAFQSLPDTARYGVWEVLAPDGDLRRAAAGFFAALRRLDAAGLDAIVAESFPETGLGRALNDRLRRAATAGTTTQNPQ